MVLISDRLKQFFLLKLFKNKIRNKFCIVYFILTQEKGKLNFP